MGSIFAGAIVGLSDHSPITGLFAGRVGVVSTTVGLPSPVTRHGDISHGHWLSCFDWFCRSNRGDFILYTVPRGFRFTQTGPGRGPVEVIVRKLSLVLLFFRGRPGVKAFHQGRKGVILGVPGHPAPEHHGSLSEPTECPSSVAFPGPHPGRPVSGVHSVAGPSRCHRDRPIR